MSRPPSDNPKRNKFLMLMDDETKQQLELTAKALGITRSEVVRRGIKKSHGELTDK